MQTVFDWAVIGVVATIIGSLFAGVKAYGRHEEKIEQHQKAIDNCHLEKLMTEEKCTNLHTQRQVTTDIQLQNIQKMQEEMRADMKLYQVQLGAAVGRLENLTGRLLGGSHEKQDSRC